MLLGLSARTKFLVRAFDRHLPTHVKRVSAPSTVRPQATNSTLAAEPRGEHG